VKGNMTGRLLHGVGRTTKPHGAQRATVLGAPVDRRLGWILALYIVLIALIVGYNAREVGQERGAATIVNIAARQRALAERYVKDVLLRTQGAAADPEDDATQLRSNADALLDGGKVVAVQGADEDVHIQPASSDPLILLKLNEERRLIGQLLTIGDGLLALPPRDPRIEPQILSLRVVGGQVANVSNDAVGQMTRETEGAFGRLVNVGLGLGVLGAFAAIAMGLMLRRAGERGSAQFRSLVNNGSDLITVVDAGMRVRYQSPSSERLVGRDHRSLVGTSYLDLVDPEDRARLSAILSDLATTTDAVATAEYRVRHEDGSWRFVESMMSNLIADHTVQGLVLNTRDVTERKVLEQELAHQAFHDSLTGLSNRAVFRDRLGHALARSERTAHPLAVLLLDLDGFKTINDSLGHDAGDELLVAVGERLQASARASDTVARLGGDEFAILLEDEVDEGRAKATAHRLKRQLSTPFRVRGREVFVRASVGIAVTPDGTGKTDELIRNADTAMYAAKAAGRGRYEVFQPAMHERALEEFEVQGDLQQAIAHNEFVLFYQPIIDFGSDSVKGMEALIRWDHPTRGLLLPGEFIRIAEETGLIVPIGTWVLREACRQTALWRSQYPEAASLRVSVNLSTRQLFEPDLVRHVREILNETGLDPSALILEITEGSLMQDVAETVTKLRGLKSLGVDLAVDDFGTGSSSLGYLRQFPIDTLKIDKSFVDDVATAGTEGPALIRAIVELAQTLHLETVAEGIEETEQLSELRLVGCSSGQGFLFARPMPPEAMEASLQAGGRVDRAVSEQGAVAASPPA
jgi:diguanylate cyclase (GGDEF)-like protein/PAS domain S-box-containing protein